ncbi:major capsid protein [Nocardiopsis gilva YIM 90087]|uniref:Major capsid protein n=1 Tax=Nocardiopsis gilva YIM 90087 TaxID=1235441 RepID=A0A223RZW4_9ACTN|nr:phage major capsid protein [Nocardiopsis gilva]ASU81411.1 major capsid protein [Nocardiopsis gilva YIM 90087]
MAITAATTTGELAGFLTREQAQPIFERAARMSVAQRLAREVPLGGNGVSIPVVTGRMEAGWVAEAGQKPASSGALALKNMDPQKIATIAVVSAEVVRANPGNYMNLIREQVAEAFAVAFDAAALRGQSTPFGPGNNLEATAKAVELGSTTQADGGIHGDFVAGLSLLVNDGKRLTGFALDDRVEPLVLGAVDTTGRPLYVDLPTEDTSPAVARPGRLLGRTSYMGEGVGAAAPPSPDTAYTLAYGGDWTQAAWGVVGGISYDVSTEATVTINGQLVSLFEHNLVAVRAEAEYGWLVNDIEAFVKYTETTSA